MNSLNSIKEEENLKPFIPFNTLNLFVLRKKDEDNVSET